MFYILPIKTYEHMLELHINKIFVKKKRIALYTRTHKK